MKLKHLQRVLDSGNLGSQFLHGLRKLIEQTSICKLSSSGLPAAEGGEHEQGGCHSASSYSRGETGGGGPANSVEKNVVIVDNKNDKIAGCLVNCPRQLEHNSFCSLIFPPYDLYLPDLVSDTDINLFVSISLKQNHFVRR